MRDTVDGINEGAWDRAMAKPTTDEKNKQTERDEIKWLHTHPDKVFLYVHMPKTEPGQMRSWAAGDGIKACCRLALGLNASACPVCHSTREQMQARDDRRVDIITWLGAPIATHVYVGPRRNVGFGYHSYRRPVSCRIGGTLYHGWYYESSGCYCRLKKAKRQVTKLDRL